MPPNARVLAPVYLGLLAALVACGDPTGTGDDDRFFENFLEGVATAERSDYDVYWLGREFQVADTEFRGPSVADFANEVVGGGLSSSYYGYRGSESVAEVRVTSLRPDAWQARQDRVKNQSGDEAVSRQVRFQDGDATLIIRSAPTRPVNQIVLVIERGNTMVEVVSLSGGSPSPIAPDVNPLVDEATFLATMEEQLRPYPE